MRAVGATSLLAALMACGGTAWAQAPDGASVPDTPKTPPRIEIGAGGFVQMGAGMVCQRSVDVVGCTPGFGLAGLTLAPRWRMASPFSVGLLGSIGWRPSGEGTMSSDGSHEDFGLRVWRLEAEGRWHPVGARRVDPWVGLDFGFVAFTDTLDKYAPGGQSAGSFSATQLGPTGGVALGVDFLTAPFLALGFEVRGTVQTLGHQPPMLLAAEDLQAHDFGTLIGGSLGLNGTFLAAP